MIKHDGNKQDQNNLDLIIFVHIDHIAISAVSTVIFILIIKVISIMLQRVLILMNHQLFQRLTYFIANLSDMDDGDSISKKNSSTMLSVLTFC